MLRLKTRFQLSELGDLFVVGQEGSQLLCAGPSEDGGTAVHAFDLVHEKLVRLYVHSGPGKVVGASVASVDSGMALLALTTEETRAKGDEERLSYFKTALIEILPTGEAYRLNVRSQQVQRVQFVGGGGSFLFLIEGMFVRLYQMHSRRRAGGGVKITAQPVLLTELCKKFQWFHFENERLYLMVNSNVRCYSFGKKEKLMWEVPLLDPLINYLPATYLGFRHYRHDGRALLFSQQRISMVTLGDGGLCLCVQGPAANKRIPVTVYVLHHACQLNLVLPLFSSGAPLVCFAALGLHMLLVWAPGHAAQLYDLGIGHAPTASLSVNMAPLSCVQGSDDDCFLTPLAWGPVGGGDGLAGRFLLLHPRSGSVISVEVDRAALLELVVSPGPPQGHLRALHAAVVHLRDVELFKQMTMHALSHCQGVAASRELLAEYLVATTHLRLSQDGRVPVSVLSVLPLTTLPSLLSSFATAAPLHGFVASVSPKGELSLEPESSASSSSSSSFSSSSSSSSSSGGVPSSPARLSLSAAVAASPGPGSPMLSDASPAPATGVSRLVQLLFGRDDSDASLGPAEGEGPDGAELVSVCESYGPRYEEGLSELLFRSLHEKEPRAKCLRHAKIVRRAQIGQVAELYKCIADSSSLLDSDAGMFRILENFYCVLEELSLSLPAGFMTHFCELGFRVLPPSLFLQYVERHVFFLSDSFICSILPRCNSPELRLALTSRMRDLDALVATLWHLEGGASQTADFVVAQTGVALPEQHDVQLLESNEDAFFLPLAIFRQHVRNRGGQKATDEMIDFVYLAVVSHIKNAFR